MAFMKDLKLRMQNWALCQQHPLRYLFLEITRQCNLSCRYCGSNCTPVGQGEEMPVAEWVKLLEHVAENFDARQVMLAIMGGEPLRKEGVYEIFAAAQRLHFPYGIVTNGHYIDKEAAQRLVTLGIGSISISMDAPPDFNDKYRGKGAAADAMAAVENLHEAGYKGILEIMSSITRDTAPCLEEMRKVVAKMRVPRWRVVPVFAIGRAAKHEDYIITNDQLKDILAFVAKGRADGQLPRPEFSEESYLGCLNDHVRNAAFSCRAGLTVAGVMYNGKVGACPELGPAFIQGDLKTDTFTNIWNSKYQIFRDRSWAKKLGPCQKCDKFKFCHGGSLHLYEDPNTPIARCFYQDLGGEEGCRQIVQGGTKA